MPVSGAPASNKKLYTILAYGLGWIGGIIFLFVGKDDPDVKWNSAQSIVIFGGLTVINIILGFIPFVNLVAVLLWLVGFIYWVVFLVLGLQGNGERIQAPLIGSYTGGFATQLADAVK
jgi:uncharacterized membrane protein